MNKSQSSAAFSIGFTKVAELLIRRGANIDAMDSNKVKPLFYAASEGNLNTKA